MPQNIDILKDHEGKVRLGHQDTLYVSAALKNDEEAVVAFSDQHFNRVTVWDGEIRSTGGTAIILNNYCTVSIISSGGIYGITGAIRLGMMSVQDEIISVGKIHTVGGAAIAGVDRLKIDNSTHLGSTGSIISDNGVGIRFSGRSDLDSWGLDVENKGTIGGIIGI